MKRYLLWIFLLIGIYLFQLPPIQAAKNKTISREDITVEFKMISDNPASDPKTNSVITLKDISHAEAIITEADKITEAMLRKMGLNAKSEPAISVDFTLNAQGKEKLGKMTSQNIGKKMAIYVDGELIATPTIAMPLTEGRVAFPYSPLEKAQSMTMRINQAVELKEAH